MNALKLNGDWTLYYRLETGDMPSTPQEMIAQNWPRVPAKVPGNVELDLIRAGVEEDFAPGTNLYAFRKYEFYQWWYEKAFDLPADFYGPCELVFEGLDTVADVFVNGVRVGHAENMLIEQRFEVSGALRPGAENALHVRIASPINAARKREYPMMVTSLELSDEYTRLRKPPHSFGWDIMPRLLSAGLWRGVRLEALPPTRLVETYYATVRADERGAVLCYKYRFATDDALLEGFAVRVSGRCGESRFDVERVAPFVSGGGAIEIEAPALWWPRGYGEAALYEVRMELKKDGALVDAREERIGIRRFEVKHVLAPGDEGEFLISVNGCPVLAKGSNWVPLDALHSRDEARLQRALDLFAEADCNIVRCWGGGVYEDHAFFDRCDELGLMVWQDFAMACALYPQDEDFLRAIEIEATSVVRKLRNHASLLLWAGDNEVDEGYVQQGFASESNRYNAITRDLLPRVVRMHDPYRLFLPSSPYIPAGIARYDVPEQHNWGARAYFKDDFYKHSSAHFVSECGYHGCPSPQSLKKFIPPEELHSPQGGESWTLHSTIYPPRRALRGYDRNQLMADQVRILFGSLGDSLEEFAYRSQVSQAEAVKFFIERARLKKWRSTGVIWWNMLDGWPQISDAVVDYYFEKKRAFDSIARVQRPICLMMDELRDWSHRVVLGNDGRVSRLVSYEVRDGETGEIVLSGERVFPANENTCVGEVRVLAGQQRLFLLTWTVDGRRCGNHYITGFPPYDAETMRRWTAQIDRLPGAEE